MKSSRQGLLLRPLLAATLTLAGSLAAAQGYPNKPIRLIVPYAPAGATDIIARAAAVELSRTLGQPVNVDNRPGAGGNLGSEMAARSAPDGYESTTWFGLAMPAGTPREIIARMNAEGQKATRAPEFMKRMADLGYEIVGGTPEQMTAMIQDEMKRWGPIVKASGAKVD